MQSRPAFSDMAPVHQGPSAGLEPCHLRRIGRNASVPGAADILHFYNAVTLIGRNRDVVDYFISCPTTNGGDYMSRIHARVIRTAGTYRLVDSSLTGVYVNDVRINGTVILQEGDTVIFGHPTGDGIWPGVQVRQPNSEFYFLFERCSCRTCDELQNSLPQVQSPLLTSAEVPQVFISSIGAENNLGLSVLPLASQTLPRSASAASESHVRCGETQPPAVSSLPLTSRDSVLLPAKFLFRANSHGVSSDQLELPRSPGSAATPDTSLDGCTRMMPLPGRSASPEFDVIRWSPADTAESSRQRTFEIAQSPSTLENAGQKSERIDCSFLCAEPGGGRAPTSGSVPRAYKPSLAENRDTDEMEVEPSPCRVEDILETDASDSSGGEVLQVGLSDNTQELPDSFHPEHGDKVVPELRVPGAEHSALSSSGGSADSEEAMEMDDIKETTKSELSEASASGTPVQVTEVTNEARSHVLPVSDHENLMGKEGSMEEQEEPLLEQPRLDSEVHGSPCSTAALVELGTLEKKECLYVRSSSELALVETEGGESIAVSEVLEDVALGEDPGHSLPVNDLVDADGAACVEELGLLSGLDGSENATQEASVPFVPGTELSHDDLRPEMQSEPCKATLTSILKESSLVPNEREAEMQENGNNVIESDSDGPLADTELSLETLKNISHLETQKPATALDVQEPAESITDKIATTSDREGEEIRRDCALEVKLQNAVDSSPVLLDTGIINPEDQNSFHAPKAVMPDAAKVIVLCLEGHRLPVRVPVDDNELHHGAALFQSRGLERDVPGAGRTGAVQSLDMAHSGEEESSADPLVVTGTLVTKIAQSTAVSTAAENPPGLGWHARTPSRDQLVSAEMSCQECPSEDEEECEALGSVRSSTDETASREVDTEPLTRSETQPAAEADSRQTNTSASVGFNAAARVESGGFQLDPPYRPAARRTSEVTKQLSSDVGFSKTSVFQVSAALERDEPSPTCASDTSLEMESCDGPGDEDCRRSRRESLDVETRLSSVTDWVEISYAEVGTQTTLRQEREVDLLATQSSEDEHRSGKADPGVDEEEEVSRSLDTNVCPQSLPAAHEGTIQNDSSENPWGGSSPQPELGFAVSPERAQQNFSPDPCTKETAFADSSSPVKGKSAEGKLEEAMSPEAPMDLSAGLPEDCQVQGDNCTVEEKRWQRKGQIHLFPVEKELGENADISRSFPAVEIPVSHAVDSMHDDDDGGMSEGEGQELKNPCRLTQGTVSGGMHLDHALSTESPFPEETEEDGVESKESTRVSVERQDAGTATKDSIAEQQTNIENQGLDHEREMTGSSRDGQMNLSHDDDIDVPVDGLEGESACYLPQVEGGKADGLSSPDLSEHALPAAERSPDFSDCSSFRVTKGAVGNSLKPVRDGTLSQQDTKNTDGDVELNSENRVEASSRKCSATPETAEEDKGEPRPTQAHFTGPVLGEPNNYPKDNGNLCVGRLHLDLQQQCTGHGQHEPGSGAIQSQQLEGDADSKPRDGPVKPPLSPEDLAAEKLHEGNMTAESWTARGLERGNDSTVCREVDETERQAPESGAQPRSVDENDCARGAQHLAFEELEPAKGNTAENIAQETETDLEEVPESFHAEECSLHFSDPEKEEKESVRMMEAAELQGDGGSIPQDRNTVVSEPASVSNAIISHPDLHCKPTKTHCDKSTGIESNLRTEMSAEQGLERKDSSRCDAARGLKEARPVAPDHLSMCLATGEDFTHLIKHPGDKETQTAAEHALVPLCPASDPCIPGRQTELEAVESPVDVGLDKQGAGCSDELAGNADSSVIQTGTSLDEVQRDKDQILGGFTEEPGTGALAAPLSSLKTVKASPASGSLASLPPEEDGRPQETGRNKQVFQHQQSQDSEPLKPRAEVDQPAGTGGGVSTSEPGFTSRSDSHDATNDGSQSQASSSESSARALKRPIHRNGSFGPLGCGGDPRSQETRRPWGSVLVPERDLPSPDVTLLSIPCDFKDRRSWRAGNGIRQPVKEYTHQSAQQHDGVEREDIKNTIAQLVRAVFSKTSSSNTPVDMEAFVPLTDGGVTKSKDGESTSDSGLSNGQSSLPSGSSLDSEWPPAFASESQRSTPDALFEFTERAASPADSCTDTLEEDLAHETPESPRADSVSEEEEFQSRLCLELGHGDLPDGSLPKSPVAESPQVRPSDFIFSDISNSSVGSLHLQADPDLSSSSASARRGDGPHEGMCSNGRNAAEAEARTDVACSSAEDAAGAWSEDALPVSELAPASRQSSWCISPSSSDDSAESIGDQKDLPARLQSEATFNNAGDFSAPGSGVNSDAGDKSSLQQIISKEETDTKEKEGPESDGCRVPRGEIFLQTEPGCSPCQELAPEAPVSQSADPPGRERVGSSVGAEGNSQNQLKRKRDPEEHGSKSGRSRLSPPSKLHPLDFASSSESENGEVASHRGTVVCDSGPCSSSQANLSAKATQTPSRPAARTSVLLKSSYLPLPTSPVHVQSPQKARDCAVSVYVQTSYSSRQEDSFYSKLPCRETADSVMEANRGDGRGDGEEDFNEDDQFGDASGRQQKGEGQANLCDDMEGRVVPEPCIPVGTRGPSNPQVAELSSPRPSEWEEVEFSWSASNSPACVPAAAPGFNEEKPQCSLQSETCRGASYLSWGVKEHPLVLSPEIPALHNHGTRETTASSLPAASFQANAASDLREVSAGDQLFLPYKLEALEVSQPTSECVRCSDEEASSCSRDVDEDMQEFPDSPTVCSNAHDLSSETKNLDDVSKAENSTLKASVSDASWMEREVQKDWASSAGDIEIQLQQCEAVLDEISQVLGVVEGIDAEHMEKWREQIEKLRKDTKMPKTYIAVVGNTGAGKSSLLNALLDEEAVLPTSAMRACTAVVVEIARTSGKSPYEADVEFLSKEEWDSELKALLEDMKDKSGNLKKRCPDRKTEAGAAYSRVKAVYGMVAELPRLKEMQEVTQHLGTVKHISAEKATDFRTKIEKFIDSRTDSLRDMKGGEFWPIVKCVRIRVPDTDVLKTGAVLVDLPGVRDSNAARDSAAKEYLKNCNAVWVVANINRAVDDKTAKDMLSASLRRQLLMDGQFGSLAFICTKTDSCNVPEIIRDLDLRDETQPIEEAVGQLEEQRMQVEMEKETLYAQLQQEQRQGRDAETRTQTENDLRKQLLEREFRVSALQREKEAKLRAISLICVQARNKFSKQQICMDFNSGLQKMRRKAVCEEDEDEEEMEDEEFSTVDARDPREAGSRQRQLQVFTVSSTEYLKLHGKLLRDGQPQVFHDDEDTEIPALKSFAIHTALQHSMVATEKLIRSLSRVISQVVNYLTNQRAEDNSHRAQVQEIVQECLSQVPELLQKVVEDSVQDIERDFSLILSSLKKGTREAEEWCEDTVRHWGLPRIGYPYATYRAACVRQGVYGSVACGFIDFNELLAEPMYSAISTSWSDVFSVRLGESIKQFSRAMLDRLKYFFRDLKNKLQEKGRATEPVNAIQRQQREAAQAWLHNFILDQVDYISKRQRSISRVLIPEVQAGMRPVYAACRKVAGPGAFQVMKAQMQQHVHQQKETLFRGAAKKLEHQLLLLQEYIRASFECSVQELNKSLAMQFEPMLKPVQKNDGIIPDLVNICAEVKKICKMSSVDYVLPNPCQMETCLVSASPGKDLPARRQQQEDTDPPTFLGECKLIRIGTWSSSYPAPIQISAQEVTVALPESTPLALPFSSVYLCECSFYLYSLILHLSRECASNLCSRWGGRTSNPNPGNQETLVIVILDKPQDPLSFRRLMNRISAQHAGTSWFQELSLKEGRERLESLGVYCTVRELQYEEEEEDEEITGFPDSSLPSDQPAAITLAHQPGLAELSLFPYGRKRAGGDMQSQPERKHRVAVTEQSPEAELAGYRQLRPGPAASLLSAQQPRSPPGTSPAPSSPRYL
ncbi:uncharacterized protein LOC102575220 isoform X2 [Alligator mississippiensis]|uniref:uncharacterized protein LOC102575220 isoform X2 n=1 Tax=Alligator mississippiensis TaxID=8496 RepID=UPI0028773627|nr:uncharacterized protein LOC102575220 isoform X2 [Alligator mississippiensis]